MENYFTRNVYWCKNLKCKSLIAVLATMIWVGNLSAVDRWDGTSSEWTQGNGTAEAPYLIETAENLAYLAKVVNEGDSLSGIWFSQTQDLDMDSLIWTPIAADSGMCFKGNYDGQGFKITNLNLINDSVIYAGLFGHIEDVVIKNIKLEAYVASDSSYSGGLAAFASGGIHIEGCDISGKISNGSGIAGGIIGVYGKGNGNVGDMVINNCTSSSVVKGDYSGGFIGDFDGGDMVIINNCTSSSVVEGDYSGGFIGNFYGGDMVINNCTSSSVVEGEESAGGFMGECRPGGEAQFLDCISNATISGLQDLGGFFAIYYEFGNSFKMENCVSNATIATGGLYRYEGGSIGGIGGYCFYRESEISYCVSNAKIIDHSTVDYPNHIGGMFGFLDRNGVNIYYCISSPVFSVEKKEYCGSFVGGGYSSIYGSSSSSSGLIHNSYSKSLLPPNRYSEIAYNTYYLSDSQEDDATHLMTKAEMTSDSFPLILNKDSAVFVMDTEPMVNDGFPIFGNAFYLKTKEVTNIDGGDATLNAVFKGEVDMESVWFEYKKSKDSDYEISEGELTENGFYADLSGLEEGEEYTYQAFLQTQDGSKRYGGEAVFVAGRHCLHSFNEINATICEGDSFFFGGSMYKESGVFVDTLLSALGCDSVVSLTLKVRSVRNVNITDSIADGEIYVFYGDTLDTIGTYTKLLQDENNNSYCSLVTLTLKEKNYFKIKLKSNDVSVGRVEGGGTFKKDTSILISADPIEGYYFIGWSDGNTDNPRTVVVTKDEEYTALFSLPYNLDVMSSDTCKGRVQGSGSYKKGEIARIIAIAREGYEFVSWSDGVTDKIRTIIVSQDSSLIANFDVKTCVLKVVANNDTMGLAFGDGKFKYGESAKISAVPFDGYSFVAWSDSVKEAERTIVMTSDVALSAIFQKIDLTNVTLCNNDYVTISVEPLTILFNGITTEYVEVYNALSQLLYEGTAERVPVPAAGVYIVKVDDEVVKVLVSD